MLCFQIQHPFKRKSKKIVQQQRNLIDKIDISNQFEILSDMVTPHWRLSYEEELAIKQKRCNDVVNELLLKIGSKTNKDTKRFCVDDIIASVSIFYFAIQFFLLVILQLQPLVK